MKRNSKLAFFGFGALVACVAFILGHIMTDITTAQKAPMVFDEIQVQSLRVVDGTGNTVIRLKAGSNGGMVAVYDKKGKTGAGLSVDKDGGGALDVFNKNGEIVASVSSYKNNNGGQVYVKDKNGKLSVFLGTDENGGDVKIADKNGKLSVFLGTNENGGSVNVYGNLGKGGIGLSVDSADGSGVVGVHALDGTGRYFRRW